MYIIIMCQFYALTTSDQVLLRPQDVSNANPLLSVSDGTRAGPKRCRQIASRNGKPPPQPKPPVAKLRKAPPQSCAAGSTAKHPQGSTAAKRPLQSIRKTAAESFRKASIIDLCPHAARGQLGT